MMAALPLQGVTPASPHHAVRSASPVRRLSPTTLEALAPEVRRPGYDPAALQTGILHLGCGAFHRAHQAVMTQRAIEAEAVTHHAPPAWGMAAASLKAAKVIPALKRQQGLYTVVEQGPSGPSAEVIGALRRPLHATHDARELRSTLLDPALRLVTLTVTEAGCCADPASGRLDASHPDVLADLHGDWPASAPGILVHGLDLRRQAGLAPPVVMSCDNLPGNGRLLRQVCTDMAALRSGELAQWMSGQVQFPNSMVDRIVPTPTEADQDLASGLIGAVDAAPVVTEPFSQWVIERFHGARPLWEAAGAQFVTDVAPWEASKLRLLNGGHLAIACIGLLAGFHTIAEAMAQPLLRAYGLRLMVDEQRPSLPTSDHDIRAYAHQLVERWCNPGMAHRLERIGRNASGKVRGRLLPGLLFHLEAGTPAPLTVLAIAAWICCVTGRHAHGKVPLVHDDLHALLRRLGRAAGGDPQRLAIGFLGLEAVFGQVPAQHPRLCRELAAALQLLRQHGPLGAVRAALDAAGGT